jgi:glutamate dehydrogenase
MLLDIAGLVEHACAWLLHRGRLDLGGDIARLAPPVRQLVKSLPELLPAGDRAAVDAAAAALAASGVPASLAARIGGIGFLAAALEIADLSERGKQSLARAARVYYGAGARFALDEMRNAARRLPAETAWQKQAVETVVDDVFALQSELAARILDTAEGPTENGSDPVSAWAAERAVPLAPAEAMAAELRRTANPDLAILVVAARQLRQVLG